MFSAFNPKKGSLLLSEPFMLDSHFQRSVVLLCEHHPADSSMGFILNNRSNLVLSDLLPDMEDVNFPVYIGGPVEVESLYFIHNLGDQIPHSVHLLDDVYIGGDFEQALFLIKEGIVKNEQIKFFIGYAGWSPNQLQEEIEQNSWAVHNNFPSEIVFLSDGEDLWKQALISLGPKYAHVAHFPQRPDLN